MSGRRSVFTRITILYILIIALAALFIEVYITAAIRNNSISTKEESLLAQAGIIAGEVPAARPDGLDDLCRKLKGTTGSRVTIISAEGRVLGDSDRPASLMDNHADRPEVRAALHSGTGTAIRRSDTLQYDFLYAARKVPLGGGGAEGVVRLSVPLKDVDAAVGAFRLSMSVVLGIVLLSTGLFSLWQIRHLRGLTRQVRDFSRSLAQGEAGKRLYLDAPGEFDDIAGSLSSMSVDLQKVLSESDEEKHRLNVILRSIPDALLIIDSRGNIKIANAAATRYLGGESMVGRPLIEVVRDRGLIGLIDSVRSTLAAGTAEVTLDHPVERDLVVNVSPLFYRENELSGMVAVFHDITRTKRLEQVRRDFVANISHELKTPITAVQGFAETLLDGAIDDRENARRFLETIRANSERINSLVDDLLTISQIEMDVLKITKSPVKASEAVTSALEMLEGRAREKGLSLTVTIPPALDEVEADRDRLLQIVTNLLENSVKFTDRGGIVIGMRETEGKRELFIEDTGIGIPEKHLPRLGERFYRVDPARSRKLGGTGLGLAIVKHLVKAHGWEMRIESTVGKGTKVRVITG